MHDKHSEGVAGAKTKCDKGAKVTDLEIHKRCAEAIGLKCYTDADGDFCLEQDLQYRPLYDNAQCLELIEKLDINIKNDGCGNRKIVIILRDGKGVLHEHEHLAIGKTLNRAVCECVANIAR